MPRLEGDFLFCWTAMETPGIDALPEGAPLGRWGFDAPGAPTVAAVLEARENKFWYCFRDCSRLLSRLLATAFAEHYGTLGGPKLIACPPQSPRV
jgi:hypothetical protein